MRQLDLFLHVTDANGAPINILHMIADADDYVVNDDNFGGDAWRLKWQTSAVTTCATDVVQRLQAIPTWEEEEDPFVAVDMRLSITLTNTELSRFRLLYAADVDHSPWGCNMSEEENTFYFNFPPDMPAGGLAINELAPYFAVDFNGPNDSEVAIRVLMSEDDWKDCLTRCVGN